MFAAERQNKIKEILTEYKQINVSSLSSILNVTETTVRKDLELLEKEGFLFKTHGGAILNERHLDIQEGVYTYRISGGYLKEKRKIADIAIQFIQNGDIVYIGGGSTCSCLADALLNCDSYSNLTVITNNLYVVNRLSDKPSVEIICAGGSLLNINESKNFYGPLTLSHISNRYVSKAFFSVDAINQKNGYMVARQEYYDLLTRIMQQAGISYVLADNTKFNRVSMLPLAPLVDVPKIITNQDVPDEYKVYCYDHNIQLFTTIEAPVAK